MWFWCGNACHPLWTNRQYWSGRFKPIVIRWMKNDRTMNTHKNSNGVLLLFQMYAHAMVWIRITCNPICIRRFRCCLKMDFFFLFWKYLIMVIVDPQCYTSIEGLNWKYYEMNNDDNFRCFFFASFVHYVLGYDRGFQTERSFRLKEVLMIAFKDEERMGVSEEGGIFVIKLTWEQYLVCLTYSFKILLSLEKCASYMVFDFNHFFWTRFFVGEEFWFAIYFNVHLDDF